MTVLAVDGSNLLIRAVKAGEAGRVHLSAGEAGGINTGPTYMFIRMLARYVRLVKPTSLVVCWDGGRSARRMALFSEYKGERKRSTPEREVVFTLTKEFLSLAGVHHVEVDAVEADDLIGGYWRQGKRPFVILSGDKDFLQLLEIDVTQIRPGNRDYEVWTHQRVEAEMGCTPEQVPLVMALSGDKSDGIPGLPGFGVKTAVKMLNKHDWDLDKVVAAKGEDPAVVQRNLALVDLRSAADDVVLAALPTFTPTTSSSLVYDDFIEWLNRYAMMSVLNKVVNDQLWEE